MASFQQDVGNQDIPPGATFVERGVRDDTVASAVGLVGNTAVELARGKATAELVGEAASSDEANTLPEDLEADLNMSQLTAARRAGLISSSEYITRLQANQRRAIAKNPVFAKSIRERGASFFQGGLDTRTLFSDQTGEKSLADKVAEAQALTLARLQAQDAHRAQRLNMTPELLAEFDREKMIAEHEKATLSAHAAQGKVTGHEWTRAADAVLADVQRNIMGQALLDFNEDGGLTPQKKVALKNKIVSEISRVEEELRQNAPFGTDFGEFNRRVGDVRQALNELIDGQGMEQLLASQAGILSNAAIVSITRDAPLLASLSKLPGAIDMYMAMSQNQHLTDLVRQQNPGLASAIDRSGASNYLGHVIHRLGMGTLEPGAETRVGGAVARTALTTPTADPKQGPSAQELMIPQLVKDVPDTLYGWTESAAKRKVAANSEYRNLLLNTVQSLEAQIVGDLARGDGTLFGASETNGRVGLEYDGDVPLKYLRAYSALLESYPEVLGKGKPPAAALQAKIEEWNTAIGGQSSSGIIELDDEGNVLSTPSGGRATQSRVLAGSQEPGAFENISADAVSARVNNARQAAEVYATMVREGKTPNIGEVLAETGALGTVLFSLDREEWTREFDAALPEDVERPTWGIR